jgi:hypothetical protein
VGGFQQDRKIGIVWHPLGGGDTGVVLGDAVFNGKRGLGGAARMSAGLVFLEIGVAAMPSPSLSLIRMLAGATEFPARSVMLLTVRVKTSSAGIDAMDSR